MIYSGLSLEAWAPATHPLLCGVNLWAGASSPEGSALGSCHSGTQEIHWTLVESVSKEAAWSLGERWFRRQTG